MRKKYRCISLHLFINVFSISSVVSWIPSGMVLITAKNSTTNGTPIFTDLFSISDKNSCGKSRLLKDIVTSSPYFGTVEDDEFEEKILDFKRGVDSF